MYSKLDKSFIEGDLPSFLWTGNDGFVIGANGHMIATDLDFYNPERIAPIDIDLDFICANLDMLFITHEHEDHFNAETCLMLAKKSQCSFVIPESCAKKAKEIGLPANRIFLVSPNKTFSTDWIFVRCIRAVHGHLQGSIYSGASMQDCGYLIKLGNTAIYQPGDTVLLQEHQEELHADVLLVSPTEHNTQVDNSLKLIRSIKPKYIIPQHHSTYIESPENLFWSHGFVDELYNAFTDEEKKCFMRLQVGEVKSL